MASQTLLTRVKLRGLAVALAVVAPVLGGVPALAAPGGSGQDVIEPVIDSNFADPDILLVDGIYYAYATNTDGMNVQLQTSTDLENWTPQGDVAPVLGDWVGACSFAPGGATDECVWAPEVSAVEGGYALYYTARDEASQRQCIGVATSASPDGPFVPVGDDPLVCPVDAGGAIDAATYYEDGQLWLLWKADGNCCTMPAIIYIQPLSDDGTTLTGPPVELIRNDQRFEGSVVEAPTLVKRGDTYYLFYSSNDFGGGNYRTGYATSSSITGPYTKSDTELMTTDMFHGDVIGPGGQDIIVNPDGTLSIVFHGWDPTYSYRGMYLSDLEWSASGVPVVDEAGVRYQAEDGVVTNARVAEDDTASGEAKVGGLDALDSSVSLQIYAEKSGPVTLGIRYANGSFDGPQPVEATHTVTVNGRNTGIVTFEHTRWGNWQTVDYEVQLKKGLNTVTFTKATFFAEIDSVDVYDEQVPPTPGSPPASPSSAVRYEAEDAVVVEARVIDDPSASGGQKIGGLDRAVSSVTFQVCVAKAGPATIGIRYASGSLDRSGYPVLATDSVTVNGRDAGTVTFAHTTWGNWQTVEHDVLLKKGCNDVTLTKQTFFAEIDAIDVY